LFASSPNNTNSTNNNSNASTHSNNAPNTLTNNPSPLPPLRPRPELAGVGPLNRMGLGVSCSLRRWAAGRTSFADAGSGRDGNWERQYLGEERLDV
jgi:hypothetical protein